VGAGRRGENAAAETAPEVPEEYRGTVTELTMTGEESPAYIKWNHAWIRNYTKLPAAEVQKVLETPNRVTIDPKITAPQILLFHTHATESYEQYDSASFDTRNTWRDTDDESNMVAVGNVLAAGLAFSGVLPVNKKLWSSTFVCVVGAYSLGMFALFYYLIDVRGWRRWTLFFRVVGLNSITIYLAQRIVGFGRISDFFLGGIASKCPEAVAAVISSAGYVAVCWLFLYFLYRKNVFLKV